MDTKPNNACRGIPDFCGQRVTEADLELVQEVVSSCKFSRKELAHTICELLEWKRVNRKLKGQECVYWLEELENRGLIKLPAPKKAVSRASRSLIELTARSEEQEGIRGSAKDVMPVQLRCVEGSSDLAYWKELIARYHYLGYRVPFGANLQYFIEITTIKGSAIAGCLQFSSPAWRVEVRDQWIGWDNTTREKRLQLIVSNSRFLILPWIEIKGLASHVLSLVTRQMPADWCKSYGLQPLLLETFVEQGRYAGTCYRAANWICLGETRGRGRMDRHNQYAEPVKTVWVYPLQKRSREILRESTCTLNGIAE